MLPEWFTQLGLMRWPLALCSVLIVTITIERTLFFMRAWLNKESLLDELINHLTEYRSVPKASRDEMVNLMLNEFQTVCFNGTRFLRTLGTISPILGLLGTILGIISAFRIIAAQTGPVSPAMIAEGLWEAMLTTAAGLMIALPALLLSYLFHYLAERHLQSVYLHLNRVSMKFELEQSKPEVMPENVQRLSA